MRNRDHIPVVTVFLCLRGIIYELIAATADRFDRG